MRVYARGIFFLGGLFFGGEPPSLSLTRIEDPTCVIENPTNDRALTSGTTRFSS